HSEYRRTSCRTSCLISVAASHRLANHHGARDPDSYRNHEGERSKVDGNLVCRHFHRAEPPHYHCRKPECSHLQLVLQPDRHAYAQHSSDRCERERVPAKGNERRLEYRPRDEQHTRKHRNAPDAGRPAGTNCTHSGHTQLAENEHPVQEHIQHVGQQHDHHHGPYDRHGLQCLAKYSECEEREHAGYACARVGGRNRYHFFGLTDERQQVLTRNEQHGYRNADHQRHEHSALYRARYTLTIAVSHRLRNHGVQRHERSHAEYGQAKEVEVAECHRSQRFGRYAAHHHGIRHSHQHHPHLYHGYRDGEVQELLDVAPGRG